jgi:hypothetical protein
MWQGILGRRQTQLRRDRTCYAHTKRLDGRASTTNKRETRKCTYPNLTARKIAPRRSLS